MNRNIAQIFTVTFVAGLAAAQTPTELVDISSAGIQATGNCYSFPAVGVSDDGRIIAFMSSATNLVAGDVNGAMDVFVRDRFFSTTELASVSSAGVQGNAYSQSPSMSDDGRYVVFESVATNLIALDGNGFSDVFLRDRLTGTTTRVSEPTAGGDANGASSIGCISGDGRFVSFTSTATNLVAGDTNGRADVFVRELATGAMVLASVSSSGVQGDHDSLGSRLSDDGSILLFASQAENLWPNDNNQSIDMFVRDLATGITEAASRTPSGATPFGGTATNPALSGDGKFAAFASSSPDLGTAGLNDQEIFLFDRVAGTLALVSRNFMGVTAGGGCSLPSLSDDGRFVAFRSSSQRLVNLDFGPADDIFVVDRSNGDVTRASMSVTGSNATASSDSPTLSGDGRWVVYASNANNLINSDANGFTSDVFAHDRTQTQPVAYCFDKVSGEGCTPFVLPTGLPSMSQPSGFLVEGLMVRTNAPGLMIYGRAPNSAPFLGGSLCVLPPIRRSQAMNAGGSGTCGGRLTMDFNTWIATGHDLSLTAGDVLYAQFWFRDPLSSPYFAGLTDALRFVIYP